MKEFDYFSQKELPLEVVYASDLVVGMTSMLLYEAALMGKVCLSIMPRSIEKAWLPSNFNISIVFIEKRKELIKKIKLIIDKIKSTDDKEIIATDITNKIIDILKTIIAIQ